jgi:hypothetical protein
VGEIDFIPFEEREFDVFFCGSINHLEKQNPSSLATRLRPKSLERLQMKNAVEQLGKEFPEIRVNESYTGSFDESIAASHHRYLSNMMNSRFCLTPRGGVPHTYRFFEALRYGTIPIGETFPRSYGDAPFVRLKNWSNLPGVLNSSLNNKDRMMEMHLRSINWWKKHASEEVIARRMRFQLEKAGLKVSKKLEKKGKKGVR